jgi:hypothetical protein
MIARLGSALFWTCILLAAFWASMAVQNKGDVTTYAVLGGIMLLVGMALRYVLSRKEEGRHQPGDEHAEPVNTPLDAMAAYVELTTTLKGISHKLDVIELQIQQIGTHDNSVQGEKIQLDAATLCNRALVLEQKGLKTAAITFYKEALLLDPADEVAIAALNRLQQ